MAHLILPLDDLKRIIRQRRRSGGDRYDEVWNGTYVMSPMGDLEHQTMAFRLGFVFQLVSPDAVLQTGTNLTDRQDDWRKNYRCPDVAAFLPGNPAEDRGSHWYGGPDLAVEILSRGDRSRQKLEFYAGVGVRELLVIDRRPWRLELYRPLGGRMTLAWACEPGDDPAPSDVLPLRFALEPAEPRPRIVMTHTGDGRTWTA